MRTKATIGRKIALVFMAVVMMVATLFALPFTSKSVKAESTPTDTYFRVKGGTINVTNTSGIKVVATPNKAGDTVEVFYNGVANPTAEMMLQFDNMSSGQVADMVVLTFRSVRYPRKVLNIITAPRGAHSDLGFMGMSLTDDYVLNTDYENVKTKNLTIAGTDQAVVGLNSHYGTEYSNSEDYNPTEKYSALGYHQTQTESGALIFGKANNYSMLYDENIRFSLGTDGSINFNYKAVGNILDSEFLSASVKDLPEEHELRSLYTTEYVTELINELKEGSSGYGGGSILSVKYVNLQSNTAFTVRRINGTGSDAGGVLDSTSISDSRCKPYVYPATDTLIVGKTYTADDLVAVACAKADQTFSYSGWKNIQVETTGSANNKGTWYADASGLTVTPSETGEWKLAITLASSTVASGNYHRETCYFTYKVVEPATVTYSYEDTTEEVVYNKGESIQLPAKENWGDKIFVGWANGNEIYKAGTTVTVDGDATYTAVYVEITVRAGVELRLTEPNGIRFIVDYKVHNFNDGIVGEYGAALKSIGSDKELVQACDPALTTTDAETGYSSYRIAVVDIEELNYERSFYIEPYMNVKYSDDSTAKISVPCATPEDSACTYQEVVMNAYVAITAKPEEYSEGVKTAVTDLYNTVVLQKKTIS